MYWSVLNNCMGWVYSVQAIEGAMKEENRNRGGLEDTGKHKN